MVTGYGAGLIWFALIKLALLFELTMPEGSGLITRLLVSGLTLDGEGIDPSYLTFFVPLFVVPIVSLLTASPNGREAFYLRLSERSLTEKDY